jgi:hypothetical protein
MGTDLQAYESAGGVVFLETIVQGLRRVPLKLVHVPTIVILPRTHTGRTDPKTGSVGTPFRVPVSAGTRCF